VTAVADGLMAVSAKLPDVEMVDVLGGQRTFRANSPNSLTRRKGATHGLENGERFPDLALDAVGGARLVLPDDLSGTFGVVLAYRGSWCPYCNAQLASFQRHLRSLTDEGVSVVALSSDDEEHAASTVAQYNLTFPVGYGADAEKTAELLKGYLNRPRAALESTNFLLRPDGTIEISVYSSRVLGRLVADDVVGYVRHLKSR
jgi:peroxiredoxin